MGVDILAYTALLIRVTRKRVIGFIDPALTMLVMTIVVLAVAAGRVRLM
jgi:hypothetical protein